MMGVIISSAVLPATLTLMWSKQNMIAATLAPILGLTSSLIAWLVTAKREFGVLTVASTGSNNPMLAGNVVALLSPLLYIPVLTYAFGPQNYDYASMAMIRLGDDDLKTPNTIHVGDSPPTPSSETSQPDLTDRALAMAQSESKALHRASLIAKSLTALMTICLLVLWPMPMYGSGYVFSKKFFTGWVVVGILWLFCSTFCVGLYPLWEGKGSMAHTFKSIVRDLTGKGGVSKGRGGVPRGAVLEGKGSDDAFEKDAGDEKGREVGDSKALEV